MSHKLEGKVALVTGGSTGIGLATAKLFAEEGAHVFITGRREKELNDAVKAIGKNVTGVQGDVANFDDLDRLYAKITQQKGRLDVLFANAGVFKFMPLPEVTEAEFDRQFNINVKGVLFTIQKALPLLRDGGSIILNASVVSSKGVENSSVYSATKAAVRSFARTLTNELRSRKIRVNAVSPGPIDTEGVDNMGSTPQERETIKKNLASLVPLGRLGQSEEIAKAALFLASDDSSFITGVELFVDGGLAQI